MDIQAEKTALIKRLEQINDISLIRALKHMVDYGVKSSKNPISIQQYNEELDQAEAEIEHGESLEHESLKKQMKGW